MLKRFQIITFLLAVFTLSACGGGGSSPAPTPTPTPAPAPTSTPSPTAASITNSNVDAITSSLVNSITMAFGTVIGRNLSITANIGNDFETIDNGCFKGVAIVNYVLDTLSATGNILYSAYDNCFAVQLNGNADITGDFASTNRIESITIQLNNVQVFRLSDGLSFTIDGQVELTWKPSVAGSAEYQLVLNTTITNIQDSSTYKFENFTVDSRLAAGVNLATISGRFIHSDYGYIDVSTSSEITFQHFNTGPSKGTFTLTGSGENADVSYISFIPTITITPNP